MTLDTTLRVDSTPPPELRQCTVCCDWKAPCQMAPHRRQCRSCRNRYNERVRDQEKKRLKDQKRWHNAYLRKKQRADEAKMTRVMVC
jgi:hypothetical protein